MHFVKLELATRFSQTRVQNLKKKNCNREEQRIKTEGLKTFQHIPITFLANQD